MKRPLIGLVTGLNKEETYLIVNNGYVRALEAAGALPVVLPLTADPEELEACIEQMDGILITGGGDIDPECYGEHTLPACGGIDTERDAMEIAIAKLLAIHPEVPTLGVCRGCQVLNVALGGTMYQDIPSQVPTAIAHRQKQPERYPAHPVDVAAETKLAAIVGAGELRVNSLHHQAIKDVAPSLICTAKAPDGIVEAIEMPAHPFFVGVQWHPERMWKNDAPSLALFRAFVDACR